VAGLAQPVLQDRRPDRILVDDDDLERRVHGRAGRISSTVPSPAAVKFTSDINGVTADAATVQTDSGGRLNES
jgi:hypothetical protein